MVYASPGAVSAKKRTVVKIDGNVGSSNNATPYLSSSGVVDIAALVADAVVSPIAVAINPTSAAAVAPSITAAALSSASVVATSTLDAGPLPSRRSMEKKRDVQPASGPGPFLDWPASGFSGNDWLSQVWAQNAAAPAGFSRVYVGAGGIPKGTDSSITQAIVPLNSYDVAGCQSACDYYSCQAFSVFMGRDTYVDMNAVDLSVCNNPPPVTTFACAVYGSTITKEMINEFGQFKGNYFQTAIAAVNGYVRTDISRDIDGYTSATYPGGTTSNGNTAGSLLSVYNPNDNAGAIGYVPEVCAAACSADHNCAGFDASEILADGNFAGTQCLLYSSVIPASEGNNAGQWGSDGKWYSFQPSVFYTKLESPLLIEDGGFELLGSGVTPDPWVVNGGFMGPSSISHSGSFAFRMGTVGSDGTLTYSDPITSTAGGHYTLSFWLANGSSYPSSSFKVTWNGVDVYVEADATNGFSYKLVTVSVTTLASNTLVFSARQDPSYFYLDDISFATV
ncbi:hypothetical protein CBS101457_005002 [Exobasidium rhododendri]|nr:hypothetical protein CBS101457_005002 [Exobasidium rhododendri]